jgi:O-antigen/teichoic acid export membrane protein
VNISIVKKNLVANFIGNGWTALLGVVLVPLYIKFLGIEAWGLIGMFASLQSICVLLDMGLSTTLNREMARLSVQGNKAQEMRNLVRTLELIYWAIAAGIGVSIFALAPLIANHWVQARYLSPGTINQAITIMALAVACQWPFGLYSGGLLGLQRQVLLSGINIGIATLRGAGVVFVLWKVAPTLQAFFLWQAVISLLQTCLVGWSLWRSLPESQLGADFKNGLLRGTWRFAAGISGITILSLILIQMDKVILSGLLKLEMFGYYVLAGTVATSIYLLVNPVFAALSPRFTQLVSLGDEEGLRQLYHHGCQLMSVVILPVSVVTALFSKEILFLWTGNSTTVEYTHLVLSILVIGTALNGLMHLPYALQLAYGWTKLAFYMNAVAVLILAPSIILMASLYGAVGAAIIWVVLNIGFVLVGIPLMHRRLLRGEQWRWYFEDVGLPLAVALVAAFCGSILVPGSGSRLQLAVILAGILLFVAGSTFLATPITRATFFGYFRSRKGRLFSVS